MYKCELQVNAPMFYIWSNCYPKPWINANSKTTRLWWPQASKHLRARTNVLWKRSMYPQIWVSLSKNPSPILTNLKIWPEILRVFRKLVPRAPNGVIGGAQPSESNRLNIMELQTIQRFHSFSLSTHGRCRENFTLYLLPPSPHCHFS